jgi:hypothetical protein
MVTLHKVEGYKGLRKDSQTGAVINTDKSALMQAKERKAAILAEKQRVLNLEKQVEDLTLLVQQLLNKESNK